MGSAYQLIAFASTLVFVAGVSIMLLTWRRARRIRPIAIALGQAGSLLSMIAFSVIANRPPSAGAFLALLVAGSAGGLLYGSLVKVQRTDRGISMAYSAPWVVTWAILLASTQVATAVSGRIPVVVYGLAVLNLGLNIGMNVRVLSKYRTLLATASLTTVLVLALAAPALGKLALKGDSTDVKAIPAVFKSLHILPPKYGSWKFYRVSWNVDLKRGFVACYITEGISDPWVGDWDHQEPKVNYPFYFINVVHFTTEQAAADNFDALTAPLRKQAVEWKGLNIKELDLGSGPYHDQGYFQVAIEAADRYSARYYRQGKNVISMRLEADTATHHFNFDDQPAYERHVSVGDAWADKLLPAVAAIDFDAIMAEAAGKKVSKPSGRTGSKGLLGRAPKAPSTPLTPGRAAGAIGVSAVISLLGSIGQLMLSLSGGGPISPGRTGGGPDGPPLSGLTRDPKTGKVWFQPPWDKGGPTWMDPGEVERIIAAQRAGYTWSDTWGWVTAAQLAEREAGRSAAAAANLQQDAQAAEYSRKIADAREAIAASQARRASLAKVGELWTRQAEFERAAKQAAAELAEWERVGTITDAVQFTADTGVAILADATGPAGQAIRAGYNVARGVAKGLGTAISEGGDYGKHIANGYVDGLVSAGADFAIDSAGRKLLGMPGILDGPPAAPVVPRDLWKAKAIVGQTLEGVDTIVAEKGVRAAAESVNADQVLNLYRSGGMKNLARLEAAGAITPAQARVMNDIVGREVNTAIDAGVRDAMTDWESRGLGVRLREVLVGDSGSSAAGGRARSVLTDADRTVVANFEPDDVAAYAARQREAGRGLSDGQAYDELNKLFTDVQEKAVGKQLGAKNLSAADVDYKSYSGFGSAAGQADAYPSGFALTRQAVQGRTTVYAGGRSYQTGGETLLDQWRLNKVAAGQAGAANIDAKIVAGELQGIAEKQLESMAAHSDAKSVAKALDRMAYVATRTGQRIDPALLAVAKSIKANPQSMAQVLSANGLSEQEFATRALSTTTDVLRQLGQ